MAYLPILICSLLYPVNMTGYKYCGIEVGGMIARFFLQLVCNQHLAFFFLITGNLHFRIFVVF